jgi:hypothetical protein
MAFTTSLHVRVYGLGITKSLYYMAFTTLLHIRIPKPQAVSARLFHPNP